MKPSVIPEPDQIQESGNLGQDAVWGHSFPCFKQPLKILSSLASVYTQRIHPYSTTNTPESSLGRRDFLRTTGIAGIALASNPQRCLADALRPEPTTAKAAIMPGAEIIVGLDIGTSMVRVAVGERQSDGAIKILGVGQAPSLGILSGEVVDSEAVVKCVREALVDAEMRTDVMIGRTHLAVFGGDDIHRVGGRVKHCVRCINEVGVEVDDIALRPLASVARS